MKFILVTGCPRSGTTAVGDWLGSAPGVYGVTETRRTIVMHEMLRASRRFWCFDPKAPVKTLPERYTSPETARAAARAAVLSMYQTTAEIVVDKEPLEPVALPGESYSEYLQDVRDVLDAQLVCLVRNPIDTIASMMKRKWGYSVSDQELIPFALDKCISIWKKATHAVLRMAVVESEKTHVLSYESLCESQAVESATMRQVTGLQLADFVPRAAGHGEFDAHVVEQTSWECQLLTCYDSRMRTHPRVVLLTGEPGVGKTTIARDVEAALRLQGVRVVVLDGDDLRRHLWPELAYRPVDREESVRRATALAASIAAAGAIVIVSMVAPYEAGRQAAAERAARVGVSFRTVRVMASRELRMQRRPENVHDFIYEEPSVPNAIVDTGVVGLGEASQMVLRLL